MGASLSNIYSQLREIYPPAAKYSVDDIPDLTGKVAIVTGGNTGIGKLTAKYLLLHNAKVYMACRSRQKAEEAIADLVRLTGKSDVHFLQLDTSDLASVRASAQAFRDTGDRLDMLYNNAGVMVPPIEQLTKQGYDLTFGTNVIGPAYFTMLLLPVLLSSVKTAQEGTVRVINVASNAHAWAPKGGIDWDTVTDTPSRLKKATKFMMYSQSKWANIAFSNALAQRYGSRGVISLALNPGSTRTDVNRHTMSVQRWVLENIAQSTADPLGALTSLYAGTAVETGRPEANGTYYWPWARRGVPRADTRDEQVWTKLWEFVEEAGRQVA